MPTMFRLSGLWGKHSGWSNTLDELRWIGERDQGGLHINKGNTPQTVGSFSRNVSGTDLIGIQTQHSQLGEVCHVDRAAETAQGELWKTRGERNIERRLHVLSHCVILWVMASRKHRMHITSAIKPSQNLVKMSTAAHCSWDFKYVCARRPKLVLTFLYYSYSRSHWEYHIPLCDYAPSRQFFLFSSVEVNF